MKFCTVCRKNHFDDSPLCDPQEYRYGRLITEADGTPRYMPLGDVSDCRSANANDAEDCGLMPLARAIPIVAHHAGCTRKEAKAALIKMHDGEWHHTGLFSRPTPYYSVTAAVALIRSFMRK